jgi:hypothetical protein
MSSNVLCSESQEFIRHTVRTAGSASALGDTGLVPIAQTRTLARVNSLFGFCHRLRYLPTHPGVEIALPSYEGRPAIRKLELSH